MDGIVKYGTITPEEKKEIFEKYMVYLSTLRYDFSIKNFKGSYPDAISLDCSELELKLELEFESKIGHSDLTCHTSEHSFMVNDLKSVLEETKQIIASKEKKYPKTLYVPEEERNYDKSEEVVMVSNENEKPKQM